MNPLNAGIGFIVLKLASPAELLVSLIASLFVAGQARSKIRPSDQQLRTLEHLKNPILSDRERTFYTKQFYSFDSTPVDKCLPPAA